MNRNKSTILINLLLLLLLANCSAKPEPSTALVESDTQLTLTNQPLSAQNTQSPAAAPTPDQSICYLAPLPTSFVIGLGDNNIPDCNAGKATAQLMVSDQNPISHWVYALAAPFFTIDDEMSSEMLKTVWLHGNQSGVMFAHLIVEQNTYDVFSALWGKPDTEFVSIQTLDEMKAKILADPMNWAILPFESIEPIWKIITVDNQSPLRKDFSIEDYALQIPISLISLQETDAAGSQALGNIPEIPLSNRDPEKMTTILVTGVTALVRGTANTMEQRGMTYPADDIRPWFLEADIVHISNEIPFAKNCPQPYPRVNDLVFCSQAEYIELLESISTDVVELSGDHFQDYGPEATLYTIDLYNQMGWKYYGGGINQADAQKPIKLEDHGNKIVFIGCNAKGGGYAGASETTPGAADCDFDYMTEQINQLRADGYLPIVTFQHLEYYSYLAHPILQEDFHRVADAGAVIVSGSQAHQPHAIELRNDSLLHYGLGNLFFDQLFESKETGQAIIDRHIVYDGRYISTELLTIQFINLARSRPMTLEERQLLLYNVFQASTPLQ